MSRVFAGLEKDMVVTLTAARTLTAEDSSKTFLLSAAAGFAVTLPALENGLTFKFIVGTKIVSNQYTVVAPTTNMYGTIAAPSASASVTAMISASATAQKKITIGTNAVIGDVVEVFSTGSRWLLTGVTAANSGVVFATT